jgi:hypothetical protein
MPSRPDEATRNEIDEGSKNVLRDVQEIGKATGAAIGWGKLILYCQQYGDQGSDLVQYLMRYRKELSAVRTRFAFMVFLGTRV